MKRATKSILTAVFGFVMVFALAFGLWSALAGGNRIKVASADESIDESIFADDASGDFVVYGAALRNMGGGDPTPGVRFHLLVSDAFYERHKVGSEYMDIEIKVKVTGESNLTGDDTVFNKESGVKVVNLANPKLSSGWVHNVSAQGYYEAVATFYGASLRTNLDVNLVVGAVATAKEDASDIMYSNVGKASLSYVAWQVNKITGSTTYDEYRKTYTVTIGNTRSADSYSGDASYSGVKYGDPVPASATRDGGYTLYWAKSGTREEVKYVSSDITVDARFKTNIGSVSSSEFTSIIHEDLNGEYILTEDLDFSDVAVVHDPGNDIFTGVFDGNGHTISGLTLSKANTGLFYRIDGATVENLIIKDVVMDHDNQGAVANAIVNHGCEIKNVYVSINSVNKSSDSHGAFVYYSYYPLTLSKSVAYIYDENATSRKIGYIARGHHKDNGTTTVKDCVFISNIEGINYHTQTSTGNYEVTESGNIISTGTDVRGKDYFKMSKQNKEAFNSNNILLTKANFVETMHNVKSGVLDLTEDIALTGDWGETNKVFTGVLYGHGHTITGLSLGGQNSGLFYRIDGAKIRDVIIKDVVMANSGTGAIANATANHACDIKNVYISVNSVSGGDYHGAFVGYTYYPLTVSNSVAYIYDENAAGRIGYIARGHHKDNGTTTVKDCVFISNTEGINYHTQTTTGNFEVTETNTVKSTTADARGTNYDKMSIRHQTAFTTNNVLLTQDNFVETMHNTTSGVLELTEDIALTSAWEVSESNIFNGIFYGHGHKITGLSLGDNGGLFYGIDGARIRDVIIKDVAMTGNTIGTIAQRTINNACDIQNVFISVKSVAIGSNHGAFVNYTYVPLTVSDSVVYIYNATGKFGLAKGHAGTGTTTLNNCVLITDLAGLDYRSTGSTGTVTTDANTVKGSTADARYNYDKMTSQNKPVFDSYRYAINKENFKLDTFMNLSDNLTAGQYVELTENIDLSEFKEGSDGTSATYEWAYGTSGNATYTFNGVFNGNGKTISNLHIGAYSGLFLALYDGAIVRDLIMKDIYFRVNNTAGIVYRTAGTVTIQNVYVDVVETGTNASYVRMSAILAANYGTLNISDSVMKVGITNNNFGFVVGNVGSASTTNCNINNCVCIGNGVYSKAPKTPTVTSSVIRANDAAVTGDDKAQMTDQNYEAYTGSPRA